MSISSKRTRNASEDRKSYRMPIAYKNSLRTEIRIWSRTQIRISKTLRSTRASIMISIAWALWSNPLWPNLSRWSRPTRKKFRSTSLWARHWTSARHTTISRKTLDSFNTSYASWWFSWRRSCWRHSSTRKTFFSWIISKSSHKRSITARSLEESMSTINTISRSWLFTSTKSSPISRPMSRASSPL